MRTYDFAPLFRSTVGFDNMARMLDNLSADTAPAYPPYNIEKTAEDSYRISIAVAGFTEAELGIEQRETELVVTARKAKDETQRTFLHRGIAARAFQRSFVLADGVEVAGAALENGLLHVDLRRSVPETVVQTIQINRGQGNRG